ncbi:hypothetical protein ACQEVF_58205 [Nonomuraea polychroma]|uniref:hypothetical protein n=1 Tax=Nonomuraea polychroma TaxID=46176 RepID=UPI003D94924E
MAGGAATRWPAGDDVREHSADRNRDKGQQRSRDGTHEWDRAIFTTADDGIAGSKSLDAPAHVPVDGGDVGRGRYPVARIRSHSDVAVMLELAVPRVRHQFEEDSDGRRTARMVHADGSWAEAVAGSVDDLPIVRQGGPRRLWDALEHVRRDWLLRGSTPVYGAHVVINVDGSMVVTRGQWQVCLDAAGLSSSR